MAKDNGAKESNVMQANGKLTKNDLGRGNQDASNSAGNDKLRAPLTTSTFDNRDAGHARLNTHLEATRETPPAKPGRGGHDKSLMGG